MYYKVMKNNKVIDVLDYLVYLRWDPEHKIMILSDENKAQAILSSNQDDIWHEKYLYDIPVPGYDTVELVEIDKYEYNNLKVLGLQTPEEIIDSFMITLLDSNII